LKVVAHSEFCHHTANYEKSGRNDWKLKAGLAQINQKTETTKLNNVEYIFINDEMRKFKAYADFGTLSN